jgi:hypothetical protein
MGRRLTLVGVFVVIEQGSMMQLMIGTAFSACYMLLQVQASPYAETSDDFLANGSSFAVLMFFLCCIVFKVGMLWFLPERCASASCLCGCPICGSVYVRASAYLPCAPLQVGTLTELQVVRDVISGEQARDFRMSSLALSFVLFASVAFTIVASFLILLVQLRNENVRMRRAARAAKARRLRWRSSGHEVELGPPNIPANHPPSFDPTYVMGSVSGRFHIFLSHVWGYAQRPRAVIARC